ncbi:similar to Saccharomyces cerevisiae YIL139C REV7 Accessory subunit of DNA polymerase zeta, involved in translesion synthesis during post-replication repair [Maudiozyma barnettii]|uniref:Similar to Saccharomyces cerevisiae YIL139C REV7 Accessory subunit of DNA polymerase zeta, involved in translesion synthesis during post-replication repair n=1 Tax=Maudiozyma barnettii TaxID=61262 RepID=A0A8H2VDG0_9SACH|nr:Rev7p [Kazachstania barnettii]CAB4253258.1 similar to Saccharomyces cerevisiae YIL139C REV7 Accessory subunit of DNA polymerase zeta, involved in translesion synthesis during post-replication repair [Kazachstania barnettii]CAD1780206.1 similar to Saccharomyces cerevisiae YIL139C REV7 Accessory subunit of DNA polymerase zeta, involved in translesion synthesis during post-replication repair [Kazachstania barnettii]
MNKWIKKWLQVYLKCFINLILYYRNVYPKTTFDLTTFQGFNLPQHLPINRNDTLQNYIEELISDIIGKLNHIYRVGICIMNIKNDYCIEKYVLDFGEFKHYTDKSEEENSTSLLRETDVFDEFRSSLNSLQSKLEKMDSIKDEYVTFEVVINTLEMNLGHGVVDTITNEEVDQTLQFERDTNWTKMKEDDNLPNLRPKELSMLEDDGIIVSQPEHLSQFQKPKIRITSLIGCDINPFIIHNYIERLIFHDGSSESAYVDQSIVSSL